MLFLRHIHRDQTTSRVCQMLHSTVSKKDSASILVYLPDRSGLLLCLLNPKYFFYAIVSMETYVLPYYGKVWWMIYLFAVILAVLGFISITLWSLFGSALTKLFVSHGKLMNTIFALMLVYCAVRMFL